MTVIVSDDNENNDDIDKGDAMALLLLMTIPMMP